VGMALLFTSVLMPGAQPARCCSAARARCRRTRRIRRALDAAAGVVRELLPELPRRVRSGKCRRRGTPKSPTFRHERDLGPAGVRGRRGAEFSRTRASPKPWLENVPWRTSPRRSKPASCRSCREFHPLAAKRPAGWRRWKRCAEGGGIVEHRAGARFHQPLRCRWTECREHGVQTTRSRSGRRCHLGLPVAACRRDSPTSPACEQRPAGLPARALLHRAEDVHTTAPTARCRRANGARCTRATRAPRSSASPRRGQGLP
jgi:hypothetical protein